MSVWLRALLAAIVALALGAEVRADDLWSEEQFASDSEMPDGLGVDALQSYPSQRRAYGAVPGPPMRFTSGPFQNEPLGFSGARFQPSNGGPMFPPGAFDHPTPTIPQPCDFNAPAPAVSSGEWLNNGYWYTQQSAVYMSRSANVKNSVVLSYDVLSAPLANLHARTTLTVPINYGYEPGLRSTFGRYLGRDPKNRDHAIEFTFLGLTHWSAAASLIAEIPGGIDTTFDVNGSTPVFNSSDLQSFTGTSDMNSYEFNYVIGRRLPRDQIVYTRDSNWVRQATPDCLPAIFGGLRVMSVNETLGWFAESSGAFGTQAGTGAYQVVTHNTLVGLQGGLDLFVTRNEWRAGLRSKIGGLVNWSDAGSTVRIVDLQGGALVPDLDQTASGHILSLLGELNFVAAYQFTPRFAARVSYDLMWVTNLALAQNQLTLTPSVPPILSTQHDLFFQGASFGVELVR